LTSQQTVIDGVLQIEDSPLVKAVKDGYVLVIDEADKAPAHVTCVLKNLVETGNMRLADGRQIISNANIVNDNTVIKLHPDFRMIVLANRPGFPFLGNNLFSTLGTYLLLYLNSKYTDFLMFFFKVMYLVVILLTILAVNLKHSY